jgi:hypothetical protein
MEYSRNVIIKVASMYNIYQGRITACATAIVEAILDIEQVWLGHVEPRARVPIHFVYSLESYARLYALKILAKLS